MLQRKERILRRVYGRSGVLARLARYPIPLLAPWRLNEIHLLRWGKAIGDALLCTPAIRELKRRNPGCRVHFYTDMPDLLRGLKYINDIRPTSEAPADHIAMQYENATPTQAHLARIMGDQLGLKISDTTPDCAVDANLVERWRSAWNYLPRPHMLILRRASNWTPNKDWQDASWATLISSLARFGTVIETGAAEKPMGPDVGSYVDLRGRTSLDELAAAVAAADMYIGPISGPMHIAAAVGTPAVVIVGGYEHPRGIEYKGQTYFYTPVPCAPCWLREPCPFDRKCLAAISPATVERLVRETWATGATLTREAPPKTLEMPVLPANLIAAR